MRMIVSIVFINFALSLVGLCFLIANPYCFRMCPILTCPPPPLLRCFLHPCMLLNSKDVGCKLTAAVLQRLKISTPTLGNHAKIRIKNCMEFLNETLRKLRESSEFILEIEVPMGFFPFPFCWLCFIGNCAGCKPIALL